MDNRQQNSTRAHDSHQRYEKMQAPWLRDFRHRYAPGYEKPHHGSRQPNIPPRQFRLILRSLLGLLAIVMLWMDIKLASAWLDGMESAGIVLIGLNGAVASAIWPAFKHI